MIEQENLRERVIRVLKQAGSSQLTTRELMERMGLPRSQRRTFRSLLQSMEYDGAIRQAGKGKWLVVDGDDLIEGTFSCHPEGYGFLCTDVEGPDLFIPPGELGGAMPGDRVKARLVRTSRDGRISGRIVDVVERSRKYIIGTFKKGYLYPTNERIMERFFVPVKARRQVVDGELAEIRITRYPGPAMEPQGEIICRLGSFEDPSVDLKLIVSEHNLPREFPDEAARAAKAVPTRLSKHDLNGRRDLRSMPLVTIDPESARDFDDAVYAAREGSGWRLWVAIADVSHYVTPGSALDDEARARSTSIYFPEGVIPMLPEEISAGMSSLKPDEDRLAMVAEIAFNFDGLPRDEKFYPAAIRSAMRLDYDQVSRAMLDKDPEERERIKTRIADLEVMFELAAELNKKRRERGGLNFDLPEAMVMLGSEGEVKGIFKSVNDRSHNMIEEFMLAANEAVARYMNEKGLPCLYRVHEDPDPAKLQGLGEFLAAFGLGQNFSDMGSRNISSRLQLILEKVEGKPHEMIVNTTVLRSMKRARYDPEDLGHFGLAADDYLHFTSPIRRYPDLFVHRMLKDHLEGRPVRKPMDLKELATACSDLERRAEDAERDMDKLKAARFMKEHVGEEFDGFISGATPFGLFVEITEFFVEGLVHESRLPDDVYEHDERGHSLKGKRTGRVYRLGDPVRVVVAGASIEKRQVDFDLIETKAAQRKTPYKEPPPKKSKQQKKKRPPGKSTPKSKGRRRRG